MESVLTQTMQKIYEEYQPIQVLYMHIMHTTASELYLQILRSNDALTPGNIWKNISISILIKFSSSAVLLIRDDEILGRI